MSQARQVVLDLMRFAFFFFSEKGLGYLKLPEMQSGCLSPLLSDRFEFRSDPDSDTSSIFLIFSRDRVFFLPKYDSS